MDVEQKYIEGKKYELDDFFIENLQEIPFPISIKMAKFIEANLKYILSSNLISYVVGGLVIYRKQPVPFALEIVRTTGMPVQPIEYKDQYNAHLIALEWPEEVLLERIEQRVHFMYENGFIEEVNNLLSEYSSSLEAFKSIGYQEVIAYINNDISLNESIEMTIQSTKRFLKMQSRWFKKNDPRINWIPGNNPDILLEHVHNVVKKELNNG